MSDRKAYWIGFAVMILIVCPIVIYTCAESGFAKVHTWWYFIICGSNGMFTPGLVAKLIKFLGKRGLK